MSGEGRGCNRLDGAFAVDAIAYDAGGPGVVRGPLRPALRGVTNPPLYGAMRWTRPGN